VKRVWPTDWLTDGKVLLRVDSVRRPADWVPRPIDVRPALARLPTVNSQVQLPFTGGPASMSSIWQIGDFYLQHLLLVGGVFTPPPVAPTPWCMRVTVSRRTANEKLTKLYWPSQKCSSKRLIVLLKPKSGGARPKKFVRRLAPPTFKFVPAPLPSTADSGLPRPQIQSPRDVARKFCFRGGRRVGHGLDPSIDWIGLDWMGWLWPHF